MTDANRNLLVRLASAAVLVPLVIGVILWPRPEPLAIAVHLVVAAAMGEFYWMVLREDPVWMRLVGIALGVLVSVTLLWCPRPDALLGSLVFALLAASVVHLVRFGDLQTVSGRVGLMVFGVLYVPLLLTPLALLKRLPEGSDWILLVLTLTFFCDTGAYFAGRFLGRHKLYPAISPKKTVEGALGGLALALGAAVLAKLWYMPQIAWRDVVLISIPGGALSQTGDLLESMIKRGHGVKDSGHVIPGHGGLLDRIDGLLFSTPYVYLYAVYVLHGAGG
jgi:phosphatidate cytidylyltransferase